MNRGLLRFLVISGAFFLVAPDANRWGVAFAALAVMGVTTRNREDFQ
jgi:hypothetical protein